MTVLPRTIPEYLQALRDALRGADPALIQDALHDAEEYLRAELAEHPDADEASVLAEVASSYGAPDEVAAIYTEREQQVELALRPAPRAAARPVQPLHAGAASPAPTTAPRPWSRRFFGVVLDPRTYGALFYSLLALPLGIFYFTWVVTGVSMSLGLSILIIGVPFAIAFIGTVYVLSLVEGRMVEALLGERMPRRPTPPPADASWLARIGELVSDARTWSTLLYMALMLPLGIAYFTISVTVLAVSIGLVAGALLHLLDAAGLLWFHVHSDLATWATPLIALAGVVLFFAGLHLIRGIGHLHGAIAKTMLVRRVG